MRCGPGVDVLQRSPRSREAIASGQDLGRAPSRSMGPKLAAIPGVMRVDSQLNSSFKRTDGRILGSSDRSRPAAARLNR